MKKSGEKCNLSDLKIGQKAKVIKLNEDNKAIRRHLLDMGITRGTKITIKKFLNITLPPIKGIYAQKL